MQQTGTIINDLIAHLKLTLNDNLVGVYLYGSLATGEFVEDQSDIDLLMVLRDETSQKLFDSLISLHRQFNTEHESWQKRIDVAYVSQAALQNFQTKPYKTIVSDGQGLLEIVDAPHYYLIDWYKVQEHGLPLYGPEVSQIMPPITTNELRQTIYDYMQTYSESVKNAERRGVQAYTIVTLCRSLYAYKFAKHVSKKFGSQWAIGEYPQWRELTQSGLSWSRNQKEDAVADKQNQKEVVKFVSFVLGEAK